jgi:methyl-accepting chemotaxis protein
MTDSQDLGEVVERFRDTTRRLTELADSARLLSESSTAFDTAKTHAAELIQSSIGDTRAEVAKFTEAASETLETSQRALRDTASSLTRLTEQIKDASRELADVADAFRKTEPEALMRETLRSRLEVRVAIAIAALSVVLGVLTLVS